MSIYYQVDNTMLESIIQAIVNIAKPVRIIMFGSRARGDARADSDLDLMIIMDPYYQKTYKTFDLLNRIYRAIYKFEVPEDILIYDLNEVEEWKDSLNHVIGKAYREGKVLYERP